jgi:hypothetical protein
MILTSKAIKLGRAPSDKRDTGALAAPPELRSTAPSAPRG